MIEKQFENSSNVDSASYDENLRALTVNFRGGSSYRYEPVTAEIVKEFFESSSPGAFVHARLKPLGGARIG